jgi:hypothetical protein
MVKELLPARIIAGRVMFLLLQQQQLSCPGATPRLLCSTTTVSGIPDRPVKAGRRQRECGGAHQLSLRGALATTQTQDCRRGTILDCFAALAMTT